MNNLKKPLLTVILVLGLFIPLVQVTSAQANLDVEVPLGLIPGWKLIHKFGHLDAVTNVERTVWSNGTIYPFLDAATFLNVSSTDVDDDLFDTGAWNVTLEGLDADYNQLNETVVLNGQAPVTTANQYLRLHRMYIHKSGSSEGNEGIINAGTGPVVAGKPLNVYALIEAPGAGYVFGFGQTHMAVYTVPANKTALLCNIVLTTVQKKQHQFFFMIREFNESWRRIEEFHMESFSFQQMHEPCFPIEGRTDIMMTVIGEVGGGEVSSAFDLIIVDNGFEVVQDNQLGANNMLLYIIIAVLALIAIGSNMRKR